MINTWYDLHAGKTADNVLDSVRLASLVDGYKQLKPAAWAPSGSDQAQFRWGIDYFVNTENFVRMTGWAFREKDSNDHFVVEPLAQSIDGGQLYSISSKPLGRLDLVDAYKRKDIGQAGFTTIFCPSQLPPGNYRLLIGIHDKAGGRGWSREIQRYINVPHPYTLEREPRFSKLSKDGGDLSYGIDSVGFDKGHVFIAGWSVLRKAGTNLPARVILQSDKATLTVNTDLSRREDIEALFKNPNLLYSGFYVTLPEDVPAGVYDLGIEKTSGDKKIREWRMTDRRIVVDERHAAARMDSLPPAGAIYGNIEEVHEDGQQIKVSGWSLRDTTGTAALVDVVLKADGPAYAVSTEPLPRPDIVGRFGNPGLRDCGFSTLVLKSSLPPGRYRVGVRVYRKGSAGTVAFFDHFVEITQTAGE